MNNIKTDLIKQKIEMNFDRESNEFSAIVNLINQIADMRKHPIDGGIQNFSISGRNDYDDISLLEKITIQIETIKEDRVNLIECKKKN